MSGNINKHATHARQDQTAFWKGNPNNFINIHHVHTLSRTKFSEIENKHTMAFIFPHTT
jgi:hypothetical protein